MERGESRSDCRRNSKIYPVSLGDSDEAVGSEATLGVDVHCFALTSTLLHVPMISMFEHAF